MTVSSPDDPFRPYVPRLVVDWVRHAPHELHRTVEGTLAFVDISGFTKLTERLARSGKVGAEEMSDALDATFATLLGVAYEDGAGLVKWGGDAVLLLFDGPEHAPRAARAAHRMRAALRRVGHLDTSAGQATLRMSVGIHSGRFDFFLVGDPAHHRELLVAGPDATITARTEGLANAGEIAVSASTAALLDPRVLGAAAGTGRLLRSEPQVTSVGVPDAPDVTGLDLGALMPPRLRERVLSGPGGAEHRTIAVAFVEFSGTDDLLERKGAAELATALDEVVRNVQGAVAANDVTFFESDIAADGGKIMLTAGAPVTSGHDEERMLRATRRIVERIGVLPLRVGVNRGGVFAGEFGPPFRRTYSIKGDAVNLAARVMSKARTGQLLATPAVVDRSPTVFDTEELPPFTVKGKARPVVALSVGPVAGLRAATTDTQRLVGRDAEMQVLTGALADGRAGRGRAVDIVGEPGIGKSRLVAELRVGTDVRTVDVACQEYDAATPYAPFGTLLREVLELPRASSPVDLHRALAGEVARVAPRLLPWIPALGPLLDLRLPDTTETARVDPSFRKARLEDVAVDVLSALLAEPTLVTVEDVHHMDDASADLMERLVSGVDDRPWTVVTTRRETGTGYVPASTAVVTTMRPGPLSDQAAQALVEDGTEDAPLLPHEIDLLAKRAEGNPFFLRMLVAETRASGGVHTLPDSVEGLLNAQLDQLPPSERTVLRYAAVLGLSFGEDELRALLAGEEIPAGRESMRRIGTFVEVEGHGRLRFRHAMIRDAAYAGLPVRRRRALHGRVGDTIQAEAPDADEVSELLSLHYYEAGRMDESWRYSRVAAARAERKYAFVAASEFFGRALDSARGMELSRNELAEVQESLADARLHVGVLAESRTAYRAARRLVGDDPVRVADLLRKEALVEQRLDRTQQTLRTLTRALREIEKLDPPATALRARLECAYARCREKQGRYREAVRWGRLAEADARAADDKRALAEAYEALHSASSMAGFDQEQAFGDLALELFEELGDREAQSRGLNNIAVLAWFEGRGTEALEMFERARDAAAGAGDTLGAAASAHNVGSVLLAQGRLAEAETVLRPLLPVFKGLASQEYWAATLRWLGVAALREGRVDEGRAQIDEARRVLDELGLAIEVTETDTAVVEALIVSGRPAEAAEVAARATNEANTLDAGFLLPSLRRLRGTALIELGRTDEAVAELEAAYRACCTHGAYESGFVFAELARATESSDPATASDYRARSAEALADLGWVG